MCWRLRAVCDRRSQYSTSTSGFDSQRQTAAMIHKGPNIWYNIRHSMVQGARKGNRNRGIAAAPSRYKEDQNSEPGDPARCTPGERGGSTVCWIERSSF